MGMTWPMASLAAVVALAHAPVAEAAKSTAIRYVDAGHVGQKGTGPGKFSGETGGVAVDQDCGDVFIGDPQRHQVQRFDQTGRFLGFIGQPGEGPGGIDDPRGMEVRNVFTGRQSIDGPPPPCGSVTTAVRTLLVADAGHSRVAFFSTTGGWQGSWCISDIGGCTVTKSMSPANVAYDPGGGGFDPEPRDVDMSPSGSKVWIAGASYGTGGGTIREYTGDGAFVRQSETLNYPTGPSSVSASPGAAFLWATDDGASKVVQFDLNPANPSLGRMRSIGQGYSDDPGSFEYTRSVEIGREGPFFDELYVNDGERVQHFDESGRLRAVINLPNDFRGRFIDVRYDGTIYVTGTNSFGARAYSPGPLVSLRARPLGGRRVELSGRIRPAHRGTSVRLERLEQGWSAIARRARVGRSSTFRYVWRAPRKRTYQLRARFKDPHPFHADRTSAIVAVAVR